MISLAFLLIQFSFSYKASVTIKINQKPFNRKKPWQNQAPPTDEQWEEGERRRGEEQKEEQKKKIIIKPQALVSP